MKNTQKQLQCTRVTHKFNPVFNKESKILILGTFPSVKSREVEFYYGHPQNRFWKVLASITDNPVPSTIEEKKVILLSNHIAIWDVIESCEITGSSDSSIRNVVPAAIESVVGNSNITRIYGNGGTAKKLYDKYVRDKVGMEIYGLPSTSPANASFSLERLISIWKEKIGKI